MAVRQKVVKLKSCFLDGIIATVSDIEISLTPGIPTFEIIGLCDSAIRESRGRITAAVRSCGFLLPKGHIVVNISPAYMHKSGSGFDFPIALGILFLADAIPYVEDRTVYAQGELALDGQVKGTPGSILRISTICDKDYDVVLIPEDETYAAECNYLRCMTVKNLSDAVDIFTGYGYHGFDYEDNDENDYDCRYYEGISLASLKGQNKAAEALTISCAGRHSLLLMGSPGCGKSMVADILPRLLPEMSYDEKLSFLKLGELAGINSRVINVKRPIRRISSNCTISKLNGKSGSIVPGELALANNGVLFADEICEFDPRVIDELKYPLEEHNVCVTKDGEVYKFPASFQFIATGNPCRCGMYYEPGNKCRCTPSVRKRYLSRLSGGFVDRIDLFTEMRSIGSEDIKDIVRDHTEREEYEVDIEARTKIETAWKMQERRYGWTYKDKTFNGTVEAVSKEKFRFTNDVADYAAEAAKITGLTGRGFLKLLRVGRTIADMEESEDLKIEHIKHALLFRVNTNVF